MRGAATGRRTAHLEQVSRVRTVNVDDHRGIASAGHIGRRLRWHVDFVERDRQATAADQSLSNVHGERDERGVEGDGVDSDGSPAHHGYRHGDLRP